MSDDTQNSIVEETTQAESSVENAVPESVPESLSQEAPVATGVPTTPQLAVAALMLATLLGSPYIPTIWNFLETNVAGTTAPTGTTVSETTSQSVLNDPFADVSLEAEAAYVWDMSTQKPLYAKNANAQLPLASLTKLMTGLIALESYDESKPVRITLDAIIQDGENGFEDGDTWKASELLGFTMISSSNDGAYALAAAAGAFNRTGGGGFIDRMNAKAKDLGLGQTYFTNPTGLDASAIESGSYGSARDMAFLMEYIIKNAPLVVAHTTEPVATFTDESGEVHTATNTNQTIGNIANALGSKTGYTELAGGNLVVAYDAGLNHPVVIAVLGSSREGRFRDVEELLERTKQALTTAP